MRKAGNSHKKQRSGRKQRRVRERAKRKRATDALFGKLNSIANLAVPKPAEVEIRKIKLGARATTFYPLVDLHLLMHLYEHHKHLKFSLKDFAMPDVPWRGSINLARYWNARGPNAQNLAVAAGCRQAARGATCSEDGLDFIKAVKTEIDTSHLHYRYGGTERYTSKAVRFLKRVASMNAAGDIADKLSLFLFDKLHIPFLHRPHLRLQHACNRQTQKSTEAHESLDTLLDSEELLSAKVVGAAAKKVDYSIGLVYRMHDEMDRLLNVGEMLLGVPVGKYSYKGTAALKAFGYYKVLLQQPASYFDLVRNLAMKHISEGMKAGLALTKEIDHQATKEILDRTYMRSWSVRDGILALLNSSKEILHKQLLQFAVDHNCESFTRLYRALQSDIEDCMPIQRPLQDLLQRYKKASAVTERNFVLAAIDDATEFENRICYDSSYGSAGLGNEGYTFYQKYLCSESAAFAFLKGHVKPNTLQHWVHADSVGAVSFLTRRTGAVREAVAAAIDVDGQNGISAVGFWDDYARNKKRIDIINKHPDLALPSPEQVLLDFDSEYLYTVLAIIGERETQVELRQRQQGLEEQRRTLYQKLLPYGSPDAAVLQSLRRLTDSQTEFVHDKLQLFFDVRRLSARREQSGNYARFLGELSGSADKEQVCQTFQMWVDEVRADNRAMDKGELELDTSPRAGGDLYIKDLRIVGGPNTRTADFFQRLLEPHVQVGQITFYREDEVAKLGRTISAGATYLLIRPVLRHDVSRILQKNGLPLVFCPSSGRGAVIDAVLKLAQPRD